jgi:hypothetical protein
LDHASFFPGLTQKLAQELAVLLLPDTLPGRVGLWISDGELLLA